MSLYADRTDYLDRFRAVAEKLVGAGFLLREDADKLIRSSETRPFP